MYCKGCMEVKYCKYFNQSRIFRKSKKHTFQSFLLKNAAKYEIFNCEIRKCFVPLWSVKPWNVASYLSIVSIFSTFFSIVWLYTANTYSGKTVEVQWNHSLKKFEKIQWFTTDHASLYFLPVKIVILASFYM